MFKRIAFAAALVLALAGVSGAADFDKIPDVTKNAKAGQWVSYKNEMAGMGVMEQKQTITAVEGDGEDKVITIKTEMSMGGQSMPAQEQKIPLKGAKEAQMEAWKNNPGVKVSETKVTANGKEYDAVLIEYADQGGETKLYMSAKVPVTGIIKLEVGGMPGPVMELADFGE